MKNSLILLLLVSFSLASCDLIVGERVRGSGNKISENRSETGFDGVASYGSMDVMVETSPTYSVRIEADDNLMEYIETSVEGGVLKVRTRQGYNLSPRTDLKVFVTAPSFTSITSSGSGNIISTGKISGDKDLKVGVSGSADIDLDVDVPQISASISGSGNMKMKGRTKDFTCQVSGSGEVEALDLLSENTNVKISGSGNGAVYASVKLDVRVSGSGDVVYKGDASVNQKISGSGSVKKID